RRTAFLCSHYLSFTSVTHSTVPSCLDSSIPLPLPRSPPSTLFPYTTLFRSRFVPPQGVALDCIRQLDRYDLVFYVSTNAARAGLDRKSTRLNSSHVKISYAVFCLKKKKPEPRPNFLDQREIRFSVAGKIPKRKFTQTTKDSAKSKYLMCGDVDRRRLIIT